jgi:hypothetical protein
MFRELIFCDVVRHTMQRGRQWTNCVNSLKVIAEWCEPVTGLEHVYFSENEREVRVSVADWPAAHSNATRQYVHT